MIIRKSYLNQIEGFIDKDLIKIISGIRKIRKIYITKTIAQLLLKKGIKSENIILINFESKKYLNVKNIHELDDIIQKLIKNHEEKKLFIF
ncbi:MAG: Pseudogene of AAA family ATPase [Methanobrevibacter sp. CfCl-M3]